MHALVPYTYQIFHPWHWLTYGNNATALAGVAAVITACLVVKYTRDQAGIRRSQDEIYRSSVEPVLVVKAETPTPYGHQFVVRNYGSGSALDVVFWSLTGTEAVRNFGKFQYRQEETPAVVIGDMLGDDTAGLPFTVVEERVEVKRLIVVQAGDRTGRRHQFHLLAGAMGVSKWYIDEPMTSYISRLPRTRSGRAMSWVRR